MRKFFTILFSITILISVLSINFLSYNYYSTILTIVSCVTLLQLIFHRFKIPIWLVLYVISIIVFLCLNEIISTIQLYGYGNSISLADVGYYYSTKTYHQAIIYVVYFLSGTYFAVILLIKDGSRKSIKPKRHIYYLKFIKRFFLIVFCFMLYDKFSTYSTSKIVGYVDAIHISGSNSSFLILADILFPVLYSFLAISYRRKRVSSFEIGIYTFIFALPYFFTFLSGFRGELIGKILALTILYSVILNFPRYYYYVGGFLILIGALGMEFMRFDSSLSLFDLPLETYLQAFLYTGNSFSVIPLTIYYEPDLFHGWRYFFGGPIGIFVFEPTYSYQGVLTKPYLAQHLMSIIDYKRFSGGSTIGSSVVAEIFLISPYLIFPVAYLIIWSSRLMLKKSFYSPLLFYLSFSYFENIIFIPRGGFLKFIDKELFLGILIIILFHLAVFKSQYNIKNV